MTVYARYLSAGTMAIALAILITALPVRLLMSQNFLRLTYTMPWIPPDFYGFTPTQRFELAPDALAFLLENHTDTWLAQKTIEQDAMPPQSCVLVENTKEELCYLYNLREVQHMVDVQRVIQGLFTFAFFSGIVIIIGCFAVWRLNQMHIITMTLRYTIILMLSLIVTSVVSATVAWDSFFTAFHGLFFEGDSWLFYYWDTLIRLFPESFWYTATVVLSLLIGLELALLYTLLSYSDKFLKGTPR